MALSGMIQSTFYNPGDGARFAFRLYWTATQNIANNTSTVTVIAKLAGLRSTSSIVSGHSNSKTTVHLDGTTTTGTNNISISGVTEKTLFTTSKTITHGADGAKTFSLGGSQDIQITFPNGYVATVSIASQTQTLDTIPRQSDFSGLVNFSSTASSIVVKVRRKSTAFTHRLTLMIGTTTIRIWDSLGDIDSLPLIAANHTAMHSALPNSVSSTVSLILETMSGAVVIGTQTLTATVSIPAAIKPTIGNVTAVETASAVSTHVGVFVQLLSRIRLRIISAAAGQGASIKAQKIVFAGITYNNGDSTTGAVNTYGTSMAVKATVTDTRDRSTDYTIYIALLRYTNPTISLLRIQRANSAGTVDKLGTYARIQISASVRSLINSTERNTLAARVYHRLRGATAWSLVKTLTAATSLSHTSYDLSGFNVKNAYEWKLEVQDRFNTSVATSDMGTGEVLMAFAKDRIGIGKIPEVGRVLDVGGDIWGNGKNLNAAVNTLEAQIRGYVTGFNCNTRDTDFRFEKVYNGVNTPVSGIGVLIHMPYSADWISQEYHVIAATGLKVYRRIFHSGTTWTAWTL